MDADVAKPLKRSTQLINRYLCNITQIIALKTWCQLFFSYENIARNK
ncbi:unnamed protein product [Thelazia callipaeda]|uniref:Transposase n=1 Tax=Thelazia callipaeda TaxID=103827 RepID=A0A0N5D656_THECL|nr:unnamed protein product [Thelazia callipaeda]